MDEGPNDWERQVGLATHEWKAAENPAAQLALDPEGRGEALLRQVSKGRTVRGEASTRKPGCRRNN